VASQAENYPFCTIDPHVGLALVPDTRLAPLAAVGGSGKVVSAAMSFIDIAGLVAGAAEGKGMGNAFLQNVREADAVLHVVRCFDERTVHRADEQAAGHVDSPGDAATIDLELLLADLQVLNSSGFHAHTTRLNSCSRCCSLVLHPRPAGGGKGAGGAYGSEGQGGPRCPR
jgi:ribosome-binding ATPase YchF (GTP1/OBG family)